MGAPDMQDPTSSYVVLFWHQGDGESILLSQNVRSLWNIICRYETVTMIFFRFRLYKLYLTAFSFSPYVFSSKFMTAAH